MAFLLLHNYTDFIGIMTEESPPSPAGVEKIVVVERTQN